MSDIERLRATRQLAAELVASESLPVDEVPHVMRNIHDLDRLIANCDGDHYSTDGASR